MGEALKKFFKKDKENGGKTKNAVIILIIFAILFLAFGNKFISNMPEKTDLNESGSEVDYAEQIKKTEKELEEILSLIKNAGEVRVKIYVEKLDEKSVARETKSKNQNEIKGDDTKVINEIEENIVTYGQGSGEMPLIISEKGMRPSGVLVVARGAEDERVKNEIFEAVMALYGLSAHRVTVKAGIY